MTLAQGLITSSIGSDPSNSCWGKPEMNRFGLTKSDQMRSRSVRATNPSPHSCLTSSTELVSIRLVETGQFGLIRLTRSDPLHGPSRVICNSNKWELNLRHQQNPNQKPDCEIDFARKSTTFNRFITPIFRLQKLAASYLG